MSRTVGVSVESAVTVDQVFSAFADERYWLARLATFGRGRSLDGLVVDADGVVRVSAVQDLAHELLPSVIAKLYPGDLMVVRAETWQRIGDDRLGGKITVATDGAPASGDGTVLLSPSRDGVRLDFVGTVEVTVPVVGGRIERRLVSQIEEGIREIERFTSMWIAKQNLRSREAQG